MVLSVADNCVFDQLFHKKRPIHKSNEAFKSLCFRYQPIRAPAEHIEEPRKPKICGGILGVEEDGVMRYALVQGHHTGKWSFPKGHANEGELPLACALREIGEEVGIDSLPPPVEYQKVGYGHYYLFMLNERLDLVPRDTNEIMNTAWVSLEEMKALSLNADISQFVKMKERERDNTLIK